MRPILGGIGIVLLMAGSVLGQTSNSNQNSPPDNSFRRKFFNFFSLKRKDNRPAPRAERGTRNEERGLKNEERAAQSSSLIPPSSSLATKAPQAKSEAEQGTRNAERGMRNEERAVQSSSPIPPPSSFATERGTRNEEQGMRNEERAAQSSSLIPDPSSLATKAPQAKSEPATIRFSSTSQAPITQCGAFQSVAQTCATPEKKTTVTPEFLPDPKEAAQGEAKPSCDSKEAAQGEAKPGCDSKEAAQSEAKPSSDSKAIVQSEARPSRDSKASAVCEAKPCCDCQALCQAGPCCDFTTACPKERIWGGAEYLLWWITNGSTPPLVTLGNPADPFPGSLGQPGTQLLFGGNGALNYGTFSGVRVNFGGWLDADGVWGLEGNGFLLERRPTQSTAGSDANGNPPIFLPIFRPDLNREGAFTVSSPVILNPTPQTGFFTGTVTVSSSSQLWGAGADAYRNLFRNCAWSLDFLAGFRYLDLAENLDIVGTGLNDFPSGVQNGFSDHFDTRNQYYAGELGGRLGYRNGRLSLDALAKVALGDNHEVVNINGSYTQVGAALGPAQGTFPGGIFTQTSNIGRQSHDQFAVVPQLQLKAGYAILPRLTATVGYDFLYWNQVVRPGNQIDHSVNLSQSQTQGGGVLLGPSNPAPLFNRTDFFAHGLSFGLEFKF